MPLAGHINHRFRIVIPVGSANSDVYLIEPRARGSDDVHWQLLLSDPATVLECFRQEQAVSIRDLAIFLLRYGRPFSTRIQHSQIWSLKPPPSYSLPLAVLGWRPVNHRPTNNEYNFYEHLRRDFFNHHPRSRAAHLKGAIIGRLAIEGDEGLARGRVLDGPSGEILTYGTCLGLVGHADSLWDDELTEADMDLICGVYKSCTGEFIESITRMSYLPALRFGDQTSDLSWWPKQSTFLTSGLWPGYWSRSCEEWFRRRHAAIVLGNADLKTSRQWYKSLTLYQKVAKVREINRRAARLYISHHPAHLFH